MALEYARNKYKEKNKCKENLIYRIFLTNII